MTSLSALKRARTSSGVSLAEVSEKSGLLVPNLSAIENNRRVPRLDTFEKAMRALGKRFVPVSTFRASAAEIAEDIEVEIARGKTNDLFRFVAQLSDNLVASTSPEELYALVIEPPGSTGSQDWDATIAGLVDYRLSQRGWPVPVWANRTLLETDVPVNATVWVDADPRLETIRAHYKTDSAFTRRGVFVALDDLESF